MFIKDKVYIFTHVTLISHGGRGDQGVLFIQRRHLFENIQYTCSYEPLKVMFEQTEDNK